MTKLTKNQKSVAEKIEAGKAYTLKEAASLVKEITTTKFDASNFVVVISFTSEAASFNVYAFPASIFSATDF